MGDVRENAVKMMQDAGQGRDISDQYNNLSPQDQRQTYTEMKSLQSNPNTMRQFGNIELTDGNGDGFLDDAQAKMANGTKKDVYNPPANTETAQAQPEKQYPRLNARDIAMDPNLREADMMLRQASRGADIYGRVERSQNPNLLDDMRAVKANKPEFNNVDLVDKDNNGKLDDIRANVPMPGQRGFQNVDVYKTPQDIQRERITNGVQDAGKEILDGVLRGRGNTGHTTERKGKEIIGDILKGRN